MPFSAKSRTPEFSFSSTIGDRDETFNNSFAFVALFRYVFFFKRRLTSKKITPFTSVGTPTAYLELATKGFYWFILRLLYINIYYFQKVSINV